MAKHTLKSCGVNTARFLKYVWPFYNIMHERVKYLILNYLKILSLYALNRTSRLLSPEQHVNNQCIYKISFQLLPVGFDVLLQGDYA